MGNRSSADMADVHLSPDRSLSWPIFRALAAGGWRLVTVSSSPGGGLGGGSLALSKAKCERGGVKPRKGSHPEAHQALPSADGPTSWMDCHPIPPATAMLRIAVADDLPPSRGRWHQSRRLVR